MPRGTSVLAVLLVLGCAGVVDAQTKVRTPAAPVAVQASNAGGRIQGVVRDQTGQGIGGVAIVALGNAVAAATSDREDGYEQQNPEQRDEQERPVEPASGADEVRCNPEGCE